MQAWRAAEFSTQSNGSLSSDLSPGAGSAPCEGRPKQTEAKFNIMNLLVISAKSPMNCDTVPLPWECGLRRGVTVGGPEHGVPLEPGEARATGLSDTGDICNGGWRWPPRPPPRLEAAST